MLHRRAGLLAVVATLALTSCSGTPSQTGSGHGTTNASPPAADASPGASAPSRTPTRGATPTASAPRSPSTSPSSSEPAGADPLISRISDSQWRRMVDTGVWRAGCPVGRAGLRRIDMNYHDFSGGVSRGALVVNADVAQSVARIFSRIFDAGFPIERMRPIEAYGGDDQLSMERDNTSAFNCRRPGQANAPSASSPHANGRAIDINPYRNPWTDPRCGCWQPSATYAKQPRTAPGTITKGGPVWRIFTRAGWIWQDISGTDYMHFDTGYPSAPLATPR